MSEQSLSESLGDAFDAAESEEPSTPVPEPTPTPQGDAPVQTELAGIAADPVPVPAGDVPEVPESAVPTINAPQSWGVAEREAWAGLDPSVQSQIDKREKEIGEALTKSGEARSFQDEFNQTVTPFASLIAAEGGTPMQAVETMLGTAATLMTGSPEGKAQRVAQLIQHYGVDIATLDAVLSGQPNADPQQHQLQSMLQQQLAPVNQFMSQMNSQYQQSEQQAQQSTQNELTTFMGAHEFADDVRMEMADLMEMASRRNETLGLDDAYAKALLLRPDIQQVIQQRTAAANAQQGNQQVAQKRQAAVSIPSGDPLLGGAAAPSDMRSQLIDAMGGDR